MFVFAYFLASIAMSPSNAQEVCAPELQWTDATYAERTTTVDGGHVKAVTEVFANASVIHLDIDGLQSALIYVPAENREDSIHVALGDSKPSEYSEISMAVEPPMADGNWPRMTGPCAIPDEVSIDFDESDMPNMGKENAESRPRFKGMLRRSGLRISYSMSVEGAERLQGELNYARSLKSFNLDTDVQGWHLFRANSYVETLPVGRPVTLRSVINKRKPVN